MDAGWTKNSQGQLTRDLPGDSGAARGICPGGLEEDRAGQDIPGRAETNGMIA
ncbi:hypothetical protein HJU46_17680, partial [Clostridium butyricum]|nr:hypothetical protein [Clostridium butyricum]